NKLYEAQKFNEAEANYLKSLSKKEQSEEGIFNLGDAYYKQKKFNEAAQQFNNIATKTENKAVKAKAYHNLGNALLEAQKLEESIAAYKKSLMLNPKDEETRYNLAYALEMLKKQQEQDKKNQEQQKKDQQDKDQENKDKQKQDQQNKDQDKNQDQKDDKNQ